jgi:hypothetical protein
VKFASPGRVATQVLTLSQQTILPEVDCRKKKISTLLALFSTADELFGNMRKKHLLLISCNCRELPSHIFSKKRQWKPQIKKKQGGENPTGH